MKSVYERAGKKLQRLTETGTVVGTPEYMAPEISLGEGYDHKADVYALAVTVFEYLSGSPPWTGATPAAVVLKQNTEEIPLLHKIATWIPEGVSQVVAKGMATDPDDRFASCTQFAQAISDAESLSSEGGAVFAHSDTRDIASIQDTQTIKASDTALQHPHDVDELPDAVDELDLRRIRCPGCRKTVKVSRRDAGRHTTCPRCDLPVAVSQTADALLPAFPQDVNREGRPDTAPIVASVDLLRYSSRQRRIWLTALALASVVLFVVVLVLPSVISLFDW